MCINPVHHDGKVFGCRNCWQCNENRIQDWVGRCIAETKTSTRAYYGTLTYGGGDHERATVLTYSDVQKCLKRLRKAGFKFKYLVSGEFGGKKGRTHWHIMLFFRGPCPEIELRTEYYTWKFWDHGYSYWDDVNPKSARYVCKYIRKDEADEEAQAHFAMSKKPPIGSEYFHRLAKWHVDNGLPPQHLRYTFDENRDKDGKKVKHYMHGATARDFLQAYVDLGGKYRGEPGWGYSPLVDAHVDGQQPYDGSELTKRGLRQKVRVLMPRPVFLPAKGCVLKQEDKRNTFYTELNGQTLFWRKHEGRFKWQSADGETVIATEETEQYRRLERIASWRAARARAKNEAIVSQVAGVTNREASLHSERDRQYRKQRRLGLPLTGEPLYRSPRPQRVPHQKEQQ